jgi:two-component system sensor histidine kinase TctE
VAETLDKRAQLANEIIKGVILPQFIILPVILALVWFALSRGLSPLAQLQERIRARRPTTCRRSIRARCRKRFRRWSAR